MSIDSAENNVAAMETEMHDLLRTKKVTQLHQTKNAVSDFSSEAFQISGRSVEEIDHLIERLRGVRQKLDTERDRLQREMAKHAELSETVLQLTKKILALPMP